MTPEVQGKRSSLDGSEGGSQGSSNVVPRFSTCRPTNEQTLQTKGVHLTQTQVNGQRVRFSQPVSQRMETSRGLSDRGAIGEAHTLSPQDRHVRQLCGRTALLDSPDGYVWSRMRSAARRRGVKRAAKGRNMKRNNLMKYGLTAMITGMSAVLLAPAQQINGVPGSPSATQVINGNQIPAPPLPFGGVIKESYKDSKPYWPPAVVPPKGAPNILLIMTDDAG